MKKTIFILLLSVLFLASCNRNNDIKYSILNSSAYSIKVVFTDTKSNSPGEVSIAPNDQYTLGTIGRGKGKVYLHRETGPYLTSYSQMDVFKKDTVRSKTDFMKTTHWVYTQIDTYHASYLATVTDGSF